MSYQEGSERHVENKRRLLLLLLDAPHAKKQRRLSLSLSLCSHGDPPEAAKSFIVSLPLRSRPSRVAGVGGPAGRRKMEKTVCLCLGLFFAVVVWGLGVRVCGLQRFGREGVDWPITRHHFSLHPAASCRAASTECRHTRRRSDKAMIRHSNTVKDRLRLARKCTATVFVPELPPWLIYRRMLLLSRNHEEISERQSLEEAQRHAR